MQIRIAINYYGSSHLEQEFAFSLQFSQYIFLPSLPVWKYLSGFVNVNQYQYTIIFLPSWTVPCCCIFLLYLHCRVSPLDPRAVLEVEWADARQATSLLYYQSATSTPVICCRTTRLDRRISAAAPVEIHPHLASGRPASSRSSRRWVQRLYRRGPARLPHHCNAARDIRGGGR